METRARNVSRNTSAGVFGRACLLYVLLIAAGLATDPFYNMGFNDDWSYSQVAGGYAHTGQIKYVGWSTAGLIIQVVYGGLLTKIFGGTYIVHRLGTLFMAALIPVLVYGICLRLKLSDRMALFGALTVGMSPLFIPHAVSFMSDPYGCFFAVAAIYAAIRSVQASADSAALAWFGAGMFLALLGGMNRQVVWVAGAAIFGVFFLAMLRRSRWLLFSSAAIACSYVLLCFRVMAWLGRQSGFHFETPGSDTIHQILTRLVHVVIVYSAFTLTSLVLAVPALAAGFRIRRADARAHVIALSGAILVFVLSFWKRLFVFPHLIDVLTPYGLFPPDVLVLGDRPLVLPMWACRLIPAIAVGLALWLLAKLAPVFRASVRQIPSTILALVQPGHSQSFSVWMPVAFILLYLGPLLPRAAEEYLYDRYVLLILPFLIILVLWAWQRAGAGEPGLTAYALLTVFSVYAVLITHDHSALVKAQLKTVDRFDARGIPHDQLAVGFEFDMVTQLSKGRLHSTVEEIVAIDPILWYLPMTPALKPTYYFSTSALPGMSSCGFEPITYQTWIPPRQRELLVLCGDGSLLVQRRKQIARSTPWASP